MRLWEVHFVETLNWLLRGALKVFWTGGTSFTRKHALLQVASSGEDEILEASALTRFLHDLK